MSVTGNGSLLLVSTGANSLVNVSGLPTSLTALGVSIGTGGTVNWGSPTSVTHSSLSMNAGGTLNTASLTNIDSTQLTASNGAAFSLPAVASYDTVNSTWMASGAGSKIIFPALTSVTFTAVAGYNNYLYLTTTTGGDIELPNLAAAAVPASGGLVISATGANSMVNVSALPTSLTAIKVTAGTGGTVNWGSPTSVTHSQLIMDGNGTLNTASLTNIDTTQLTASGGANFALPAVASYDTTNTTWLATGAGSKLSLPALTTVTFTNVPGYNNYLYLDAATGGDVELPNLASYAIPVTGGLVLSATGAGSVVNVPALPTNLTALYVTAGTGGTVNWGSPTSVTNSQLTLDTAGTLNTASVTNIDGSTLAATNGATFTLPAVTSYNTTNRTWKATGAGSKLILPALTSVTFTYVPLANNYLYLDAISGGDVELPNLASYAIPVTGGLVLSATGAGSLVNVPALPKSLTALYVTAGTGGTVNWGSPTAVTNSQLTLDTAGTLNTASVTNIDGSTLTATNGATFTLPAVTSYNTTNRTWTANGAGSKLFLPALTSVTFTYVPQSTNYFYLTAGTGGDVDLPAFASFAVPVTGGLIITSSGANSFVELPSLRSTVASPQSGFRLSGGGGVILGAPAAGRVELSFSADFTNLTGSLEILEDGVLAETIPPTKLNTWQSFQFDLPPAGTVEFLTTGTSSAVTLASYLAAPEPASLALLALSAAALLLRRR